MVGKKMNDESGEKEAANVTMRTISRFCAFVNMEYGRSAIARLSGSSCVPFSLMGSSAGLSGFVCDPSVDIFDLKFEIDGQYLKVL